MLVKFTSLTSDYSTYLHKRRGLSADAFMKLASPAFARDRQQVQEGLTRLRLPGIG